MNDIEPAVTIAEVMRATGKGRTTVYRMLEAGEIPCHKGVGGYVIPRPMFRRWLAGDWTPPTQMREPVTLIHSRKAS